MSVRVGGLPVAPERAALAQAFPQATPRLVVFVHGLMEEEHSWRLGRRQGREDYGSRLPLDLGCTPLHVRYNSGRHISENGRSLADLLDAIVAAWPVEVGEIALVGHSMGGLVARNACHVAALDEAAWVRNVRHVVSLGSPHLGAPLEVPLLEGATHCFVSATVTRSPRHPVGATNHIALLNHPAVYEKLHAWLR